MSKKIDVVHGSGNVFRDFGFGEPEALQLKAKLAAAIISVLDQRKLSVRAAGLLTGTAAADLSRIRNAKLDRFTIDRLMAILGRLDRKIEITIAIRQRRRAA